MQIMSLVGVGLRAARGRARRTTSEIPSETSLRIRPCTRAGHSTNPIASTRTATEAGAAEQGARSADGQRAGLAGHSSRAVGSRDGPQRSDERGGWGSGRAGRTRCGEGRSISAQRARLRPPRSPFASPWLVDAGAAPCPRLESGRDVDAYGQCARS